MTAKLYTLNPKGEPEPAFRVDRVNRCVVWEANGLRLVHESQFTALAAIFAANSWFRHANAVWDAELKLSEPDPVDVVRSMLAASVAEIEGAGQ